MVTSASQVQAGRDGGKRWFLALALVPAKPQKVQKPCTSGYMVAT